MTHTKDEALKLALEALEKTGNIAGYAHEREQAAITAIKQARAAPPTHKTARWTDEEYREISDQVISTLVEYGAELRTADCQMQILREELAESRRKVAQLKAQRQWVGLTDEEIQIAWDGVMDGAVFTRRKFYKAIEAKLRSKNA